MRGAGGYLVLRFHDDGIRYSGEHEAEQVFVVGKGTEDERVFRQDRLQAASNYTRETKRVLLTQTAGNLPNEAMRLLYEEALV